MSLFQPDSRISLSDTAYVARLSQRDVSLQVPLNFVPVVGAGLTAVCFPNKVYNITAAALCTSNLLFAGFRRLELDVYWDTTRKSWSLCPVQLGDPLIPSNQTSATSNSSIPSTTSTRALAQNTLTRVLESRPRALNTDVSIVGRGVYQLQPGHDISLADVEIRRAGHPSANDFRARHYPRDADLVTKGGYSCSPNLDLGYFTKILNAYLEATATNLNATLHYLILHVHAASPAAATSSPAQAPPSNQLPVRDSSISAVLRRNLSSLVYTPSDLSEQRANLNATDNWFDNAVERSPDPAYFNLTTNGSLSTSENGWPGEGYVELRNTQRMLIGFGRIDPQMRNYNFTADNSYIFPPGYIQNLQTSFNGSSTNGFQCQINLDRSSVAATNTSWSSVGVFAADSLRALSLSQDLLNCGISPILNQSLDGRAADQSPEAYLSFGLNTTIWSWAPGEPRQRSSSGQAGLRCAALNVTSGYWQARRCGESHYGGCRRSEQPYVWDITEDATSFANVADGCDDDATFSVPRTGLENQYLLARWRQWNGDKRSDDGDDLIWLNLNDLDVNSCWVTGQNATCPYPAPRDNESRAIIVPVVAAVIIFVITALTIFVKCAANRRSSRRRRRRGDDGWDYEGVPL